MVWYTLDTAQLAISATAAPAPPPGPEPQPPPPPDTEPAPPPTPPEGAVSLRFLIIDPETGAAIQGARVLLDSAEATTGVWGIADFTAPPGVYSYEVSKEGYETLTGTIDLTESTELEFTLTSAAPPEEISESFEATMWSLYLEVLHSAATPHPTYDQVHDAQAATVLLQAPRDAYPARLPVGQFHQPEREWWAIARGALYFDTSALPESIEIVRVSLALSIYDPGAGWWPPTDHFDLTVVNGEGLSEPEPAQSDYGYLLGQTDSLGSINTSRLVEGEVYEIELGVAALEQIARARLVKFGLRSSRDIAAEPPSGAGHGREFVWILTPKLWVTYRRGG